MCSENSDTIFEFCTDKNTLREYKIMKTNFSLQFYVISYPRTFLKHK